MLTFYACLTVPIVAYFTGCRCSERAAASDPTHTVSCENPFASENNGPMPRRRTSLPRLHSIAGKGLGIGAIAGTRNSENAVSPIRAAAAITRFGASFGCVTGPFSGMENRPAAHVPAGFATVPLFCTTLLKRSRNGRSNP